MANRCGEGLIMDPFTVSRGHKMGCLCVSHKLKDITIVALVLSFFGIFSFTLSIWFFNARSALIELESLTTDSLRFGSSEMLAQT